MILDLSVTTSHSPPALEKGDFDRNGQPLNFSKITAINNLVQFRQRLIDLVISLA